MTAGLSPLSSPPGYRMGPPGLCMGAQDAGAPAVDDSMDQPIGPHCQRRTLFEEELRGSGNPRRSVGHSTIADPRAVCLLGRYRLR